MDLLGKAYEEGLNVVRQFRASGANYEPGTQVWQVETGHRAYVTRAGSASSIDATYLLLATGAQERPAPFPRLGIAGRDDCRCGPDRAQDVGSNSVRASLDRR
uniref:hypothetical protein n=1 Tax=Agrobacterium fabrum TaxID=1176649 RepID=UPI0028FC1BB2|nr:hypothetical protein [Agrobacterium fabrum]